MNSEGTQTTINSKSTDSIQILCNDEQISLAPGTTLTGLLTERAILNHPGIAIAVGGAVVPRDEWSRRSIFENDEILIITAAQGG